MANRTYKYWKAKMAENRKWMDAYKLEKGCAECGYRAHAVALDFHHKDSETKAFTIATHRGLRSSRLLAEMDKCEVLCANCHRVHTEMERQRAKHEVRVAKEIAQHSLRLEFKTN